MGKANKNNQIQAMRIDLKALLEQEQNVKELKDVWTLFLCFSRSNVGGNEGKEMILYKHQCMELFVENSEFVLKMFSKNRFVEVYRKEIVEKEGVNTLIVSFVER